MKCKYWHKNGCRDRTGKQSTDKCFRNYDTTCERIKPKKRVVRVRGWAWVDTRMDGSKWVPTTTHFRFGKKQIPCIIEYARKYAKGGK